MDAEKAEFLKSRFTVLLKKVPSATPGQWGKMTFQQMIEHFSDSVRIASGKTLHRDIVTPEQHLQRMRDFLLSDKPFKENTNNPLMPIVPPPVRNPSIAEAINELQYELHYFFTIFEKNNLMVTRNPFFGDLTFEENIQLLHKHAIHHLKQFGIEA